MSASTTVEPAAATAESAKAPVFHAGEAVVAAHLGLASAANAAEGAPIAAGILAFKTLRTEAFSRGGSFGARLPAMESFGAPPDRRIPTESGSAAETTLHRSIGIRDT